MCRVRVRIRKDDCQQPSQSSGSTWEDKHQFLRLPWKCWVSRRDRAWTSLLAWLGSELDLAGGAELWSVGAGGDCGLFFFSGRDSPLDSVETDWHPKFHGRGLGVQRASVWLPAKYCLQIPWPHTKQRLAPSLSGQRTPPGLSRLAKRSGRSLCWPNTSKNWETVTPFLGWGLAETDQQVTHLFSLLLGVPLSLRPAPQVGEAVWVSPGQGHVTEVTCGAFPSTSRAQSSVFPFCNSLEGGEAKSRKVSSRAQRRLLPTSHSKAWGF